MIARYHIAVRSWKRAMQTMWHGCFHQSSHLSAFQLIHFPHLDENSSFDTKQATLVIMSFVLEKATRTLEEAVGCVNLNFCREHFDKRTYDFQRDDTPVYTLHSMRLKTPGFATVLYTLNILYLVPMSLSYALVEMNRAENEKN